MILKIYKSEKVRPDAIFTKFVNLIEYQYNIYKMEFIYIQKLFENFFILILIRKLMNRNFLLYAALLFASTSAKKDDNHLRGPGNVVYRGLGNNVNGVDNGINGFDNNI